VVGHVECVWCHSGGGRTVPYMASLSDMALLPRCRRVKWRCVVVAEKKRRKNVLASLLVVVDTDVSRCRRYVVVGT
jgi:hypothetical protein